MVVIFVWAIDKAMNDVEEENVSGKSNVKRRERDTISFSLSLSFSKSFHLIETLVRDGISSSLKVITIVKKKRI